jgi:hypothetical protein
MVNRAEFVASLPPIQSACKFGQGACRVQFDIPESELAEALKLATMHDKRLRVVVEVEDGE